MQTLEGTVPSPFDVEILKDHEMTIVGEASRFTLFKREQQLIRGVQRGRSTYYRMQSIVGEASSLCPSNKKQSEMGCSEGALTTMEGIS